MKKTETLATTTTPDGRTVGLFSHDGRYSIRIDGLELMSTRQHASEEKLAELVCAPLAAKRAAKVLIGGLGFGYTLRAALRCLAPDARVVVAELLPAVVAWNRDPNYPLAADALADPRVRVIERDVAAVLATSPGLYDGIMLDTDNGPDAFSTAGNDRLYQEMGLYQVRAALTRGGTAAFWSAAANPRFANLLKKAGFGVEVTRARANGESGGWHTIFVAQAEATLTNNSDAKRPSSRRRH